jgi:hypothetical protein
MSISGPGLGGVWALLIDDAGARTTTAASTNQIERMAEFSSNGGTIRTASLRTGSMLYKITHTSSYSLKLISSRKCRRTTRRFSRISQFIKKHSRY